MLIDSHAHINFKEYEAELEDVIRRSLENKTWVINVGSNYESSKKAVEIADKFGLGVFAAVGCTASLARFFASLHMSQLLSLFFADRRPVFAGYRHY